MTRSIHYLTLQYLRGIRAYHFRNPLLLEFEANFDAEMMKMIKDKFGECNDIITVEDMCECFDGLFNFLLSRDNESIKSLIELRTSCKILLDHLVYKGQFDEKLVDNKLYQDSIALVNTSFKRFKF